MKLKLSTLVLIIGVIFFVYYYSVQQPAIGTKVVDTATAMGTQVMDTATGMGTQVMDTASDIGTTMIDATVAHGNQVYPTFHNGNSYDAEFTQLQYPVQENFGVTVLDDAYPQEQRQLAYNPDDVYELAGNVRPDNVMPEPVTML